MWRWLDRVKKPEKQKKEAAEQKRKAADTGDNENKRGGKTKKMGTFNMKWLTGREWLVFDRGKNIMHRALHKRKN